MLDGVGYDVTAIRTHFPALAEGAAHFDGPGGSQVPDVVGAAVAATLCAAIANRGTVTAAERRADGIVLAARQAAADLLGARPEGIVFGRSTTQLTYDFSRVLAKDWVPGDEVVVTRLDHDANIRPWVQAAEARGVAVRWAEFDAATGELPVHAVADLLSDRTRLVAVTAASNLLGTRPDIPAIAARAHQAGALCYVDGVHLTPHAPVDLTELGADFYGCSPYKFLGPHLGLVAARPEVLRALRPDKLAPSPDTVPERFELGTLPYELLAGTTAAIDFLADLVPGAGTRRQRLLTSLAALEEHERALLDRLDAGLAGIPRVVRYGSPTRFRTPTVLFSVDGLASATVYQRLAEHGVNVPAGTFYALECSRRLGLGDTGALRAGIAPYTTAEEVDRLLTALTAIAATAAEPAARTP
ncbi:cysteine desulfurase-like protein [Goodfellowiella coeruleoviolacea]|uniref:Cysteine desulfurase family protein, VC1184 subfamily n=1 Tax=Goodfellowiella coeruleoviolacea TaxID=334858 RepID=A0AAE3KE21_9PSEU|nr:cysteine desulfurase-like protein [Goodfellowiella coeruleoviolacea]MCP2163355.1 cysteine desulfurase family protein, VC1184 subfamily [Goodfellowiella coeruleoviolacea]